MRLFIATLPFLLALALLGALAIFLAETFTFLAIQAFHEINDNGSALIAFFGVIAGVAIFSLIAFDLIRGGLHRIADKKTRNAQSAAAQTGITSKMVLSFIAYELLKLYLKKTKKN